MVINSSSRRYYQGKTSKDALTKKCLLLKVKCLLFNLLYKLIFLLFIRYNIKTFKINEEDIEYIGSQLVVNINQIKTYVKRVFKMHISNQRWGRH